MYSKKVICTRIDIKNTQDIFKNREPFVKQFLETEYKGKCFDNCFIVDILEINKIGRKMISTESNKLTANITVLFTASVLVFQTGDTITDCIVNKVDAMNNLICECKRLSADIFVDRFPIIVQKGDTIPLTVRGCLYKSFHPNIAVYGEHFSHQSRKDTPTFTVKVSKSNTVNTAIKEYSELKKLVDSLKKDIREFFINLMDYETKPLKKEDQKKDQKKDQKEQILIQDLEKLEEGKQIRVSVPKHMPLSLGAIALNNADTLQVIDNTYEHAITYLIQIHTSYMLSIISLCDQYNTMEKINKNKKIWELYKKS